MKYVNGRYYVGATDKRYIIHPNENIILGLRWEPKLVRTQNQLQNDTEIRKNQKIIEAVIMI